MEFCDVCDNMMSLDVNDDDKLIYKCGPCKKDKGCDDTKTACVYRANYGGNEKVFYDLFINKYTFRDPTLPRVKNITCPNNECNSKNNSEVIYIRYNNEDMKYIYLCCHCKMAWVSPEYHKTETIYQFPTKND